MTRIGPETDLGDRLLCAGSPSSEAVGTELFQLFVCNQAWLERGLEWIPWHGGQDPKQRRFVVDDTYDDGSARERLEAYLHGCNGDTWKEVVTRVPEIGFSEFEDCCP